MIARLTTGSRVRVLVPTLAREVDRLVLTGDWREEVGTILRAYRPGTQGSLHVVEVQMRDRVLVGLSLWIAGPAVERQMDLFGALEPAI